jgi:outer membrane cobalamin receptor
MGAMAFAPVRAQADSNLCPAGATDQAQCRPPELKKLRRPIRLLARSEIKAAGNYREIPLSEAQEAPLSERASDVLQKQTGVQVNRAGAPGTQSLLGVRGSSPEQVEFFLEGMPLPRPYNAPLNLETLPLPLFKSVDIYPSFIPSHLPATNIGGAMNFRLREVSSGGTEYLTQTTANSLLASSIAMARLTDVSLNFVNFEQSRNRYSYKNNNGTPENPDDDTTKLRTNEDFTRIGYTAFYQLKADQWKFATLVDINHSDRGLPGVENQPLSAVRKVDDRASLGVVAERPFAEYHRAIFFASGTFDASEVKDPKLELFFSKGQKSFSPQAIGGATYALRAGGFDAALHARGKYQTVVLNSDRIAERHEAQGATTLAYDRNLFRVAAQANATASRDRAAANAFFASSAQVFDQQGFSVSGLAALRPFCLFKDENHSFHNETTLEIYAQASSAYRPPTLYERFGDNVFVTPSEKLKAENAVTNAGGIRGSLPCFLKLTCSLRSEAWLTGAKDYIIFTQNSARTLIAVNASSAQIWGIENEALFNWPGLFLLSLRYIYLDARDYGNIPYYQDKYLPLRPRHHGVAALTLFYRNFRVIGNVEYRGAVFRDRYNSYFYYLQSKTLVDVGIDYIFQGAAKHTMSFAVKNILDNTDVDIIGYTVPGRYFLVKWMAEW